MKLLSIGNSFSQDAHRWLHQLAEQHGVDIQTVNLYIGGCSLERHWTNVEENNALYSMEPNGNPGEVLVSIAQMLESDTWDVITLQQVSGLSGLQESYEPYLSSLAALVREKQPQAKLYFHQTWAYEKDFVAERYEKYDSNQLKMFQCIQKVTYWAAEKIGADLIPTGEVIQRIRQEVPEFQYLEGGQSLCRDGFHLTRDYGRYAAAAVWLAKLAGIRLECRDFEDFDRNLLEKIVDKVNEYFAY